MGIGLYRVKITRCLDIVFKGSCDELIDYIVDLLGICGGNSRIYVHILDEDYTPSEPVCIMDAREAQPDKLQQCCQP